MGGDEKGFLGGDPGHPKGGGTLRIMLMAVRRVLCRRAALPGVVPQTAGVLRELPVSEFSSISRTQEGHYCVHINVSC